MSKFELAATTSRALSGPFYEGCIEGLSQRPAGDTPFCLSIDVIVDRQEVSLQPGCTAWTESNGTILRNPLGIAAPEITKAFCLQAMTFAGESRIFTAASEALGRIFPDDSDDFHIAICPHGILLVAEGFAEISRKCGFHQAIGALIPEKTTQHEELTRLAGLEACARALLAFQEQGYDEPQIPDFQVIRG